MPDYVRFNPVNGYIIQHWISVDSSIVENEVNVIQIDRNVYQSLTKYHKVDNGMVREMTQTEKDTLLAEEAQAIIDAENARIVSLDDGIEGLPIMTLTKIDNAINNIGNLNDAKVFLKKLCRYIIKFIARQ